MADWLAELTWACTFKHCDPTDPTDVSKVVPQYPCMEYPESPLNHRTGEAMDFWLQYSDFYQFPHVTVFESYPQSVHAIETANLQLISQRMDAFNKQDIAQTTHKWKQILKTVHEGSRKAIKREKTAAEQMQTLWGIYDLCPP